MDTPLFFNPKLFPSQKVTQPFHNTFSNFEVKEKLGFKFILNPSLVPYQGYFAKPDESSNSYTAYSFYKKSIDAFCENLPKHDALILKLHPSINYVLPFIWRGFQVSTRFTFLLNLQEILNYKESLKREIKKAEKDLIIETSSNIEELFQLKKLNQKARNTPLDFDLNYLNDFYTRFATNNKAKLLIAKKENTTIGALLLVYDNETAYYLAGAIHPDYRTSGALSILLNYAIQESRATSKYFDFEGSMEPGIARYFASFGAEATPYFLIENYPNKLAKAALKAKKMIG